MNPDAERDKAAVVKALEDKGVLDGPVLGGAWLTTKERERVAEALLPVLAAIRAERPNKGEVLAAISTPAYPETSAAEVPEYASFNAGLARAHFEVEKLFTDRAPKPLRTPGFDGVEGTEWT